MRRTRGRKVPALAGMGLWGVMMLLVAAMMLSACAGGVGQQIKTGYRLAEDNLDRTERYYDAGLIDGQAARKRLEQIKDAKAGLDVASAAYVRCSALGEDCDLATNKAATARAVLTEIEAFLVEVKP